MKSLCLPVLACAIATAACTPSPLRMPTDAQLTQLLHSERAAPNDPKAPIDRLALDCLRAWSGNAELMRDLSKALVDDAGRKDCRARVDGFIKDATRNPDHVTFDEVSAEPAVQRVVALARDHAPPPPNAVTRPIASAPLPGSPIPPVQPAPSTVDLGVAGTDLQDAEDQCHKAQVAAGAADASAPVKGFAKFCGRSLVRLRTNMETMKRNGADDERMRATSQSARNLANNARAILGAGK
jgi:hypothetical protein